MRPACADAAPENRNADAGNPTGPAPEIDYEIGVMHAEVSNGEVTRLLKRWNRGDSLAFEQLIPIVYDELRALAGHYLRLERSDHTLQSTALVHEAYLRLVDQRDIPWEGRRHFFAIASRIMRHILVDHARRHAAAKRGHNRAPIEEALTILAQPDLDLVALNLALESLGRMDEIKLRIVELRFFGGLSVEETADVLGMSPATVKRGWSVAKLWLYQHMHGGEV